MTKKDKFYFSHDFGARSDPKLQNVLMELGCEGIGAYWCIIEQLYEESGYLPITSYKSISFVLHLNYKVVERLINEFGLFENDGEMFWSKSVLERLALRKELSDKRREAVLKRWKSKDKEIEKYKSNTIVSNFDTNVIQGKERKGKEIKEKEINKDIKLHSEKFHFSAVELNNWSKSFFENKYINEATLKTFNLLITKDNYTVEQVQKAINFAKNDDFWDSNFLSPNKLRKKDKSGVAYIDVFLEQAKKNKKTTDSIKFQAQKLDNFKF